VFWFLVVLGGIFTVAFLCFFKDTFRKERSVTYQNVLARRVREQLLSGAKDESRRISEKGLQEYGEQQTSSKDVEPQRTVIPVSAIKEVKLSIADINPFPPYISILRRKNNLAVLVASGEYAQ
jgi:hypothetical protein